MKTLFRLLLVVVSGVSTLYFAFWVGGTILMALHLPNWLSLAVSLAAAVAVGRYVWLHTASVQAGLISSIVIGAVSLGVWALPEGSSGRSSSCLEPTKGHSSVSSSQGRLGSSLALSAERYIGSRGAGPAERSRDCVESRPEVLDAQIDVIFPRPTRDVVLITVPLVDLECRSVVQSSRLTFNLGVRLRPLGAPRRIENEKSAGGVE
jgi:hypothetical protein